MVTHILEFFEYDNKKDVYYPAISFFHSVLERIHIQDVIKLFNSKNLLYYLSLPIFKDILPPQTPIKN